MRQAEGGSARLDLSGVHFSLSPQEAFPISIQPHLMVLLRCPDTHQGLAALEVTFEADGESMDVRNVQPVTVEPGKFGYNLVQATLEVAKPSNIEAQPVGDATRRPLQGGAVGPLKPEILQSTDGKPLVVIEGQGCLKDFFGDVQGLGFNPKGIHTRLPNLQGLHAKR